jgi:hypothetical protein
VSQVVPKCELQNVELTEDTYLDLKAFLDGFGLEAIEASIILEVHRYPEHHVDLGTLEKKIPSELLDGPLNIERRVKKLVEEGFLRYYESRKPEPCVLCDEMGRVVAWEMMERCISTRIEHYLTLHRNFMYLQSRRCFDPEGFSEGDERQVSLGSFKLLIKIEKIRTSSQIHRIENGIPEYDRHLIGHIEQCPRCGEPIAIDFSYNPTTIYVEGVEVRCDKCKFEFMLARHLKTAWNK